MLDPRDLFVFINELTCLVFKDSGNNTIRDEAPLTTPSTMAGAETGQQSRKAEKTHLASSNHKQWHSKTVVRRLPPNLPEDVFWQSIQAWVTDVIVTWKVYHPGKLRK